MKSLLIRWWKAWRRSRWETAQIRHQLTDERGQGHLDRQKDGVRDIPFGGGGVL